MKLGTGRVVDALGDSVPKPLGFIAFAPEWLAAGAARRRPAIPAPGSALGSHPCVATILRPGEASITGTNSNRKLLAAATIYAVQQTSGPGCGHMAGFGVTTEGEAVACAMPPMTGTYTLTILPWGFAYIRTPAPARITLPETAYPPNDAPAAGT